MHQATRKGTSFAWRCTSCIRRGFRGGFCPAPCNFGREDHYRDVAPGALTVVGVSGIGVVDHPPESLMLHARGLASLHLEVFATDLQCGAGVGPQVVVPAR